MKRGMRVFVMTAAAVAMLGGTAVSAAAADPAGPVSETITTTAAVPELFGQGVRDWCSHEIDYDGAPVYDGADPKATKTGSFNNGDTVRALCGSGDYVTGKSYSACGGTGTTYVHYTTKPSWSPKQQSRYVPLKCFINN